MFTFAICMSQRRARTKAEENLESPGLPGPFHYTVIAASVQHWCQTSSSALRSEPAIPGSKSELRDGNLKLLFLAPTRAGLTSSLSRRSHWPLAAEDAARLMIMTNEYSGCSACSSLNRADPWRQRPLRPIIAASCLHGSACACGR